MFILHFSGASEMDILLVKTCGFQPPRCIFPLNLLSLHLLGNNFNILMGLFHI